MCPDPKKMAELANAAAGLKKVSDTLNADIEALNNQLASMEIGVTVWGCELESRNVLVDEGERDERTIVYATELGYTRVDGEWQIAVREVQYIDEGAGVDYLDQGDPKPLIHASRANRMEACRHFDSLVDSMLNKVEQYKMAVEKAKNLI